MEGAFPGEATPSTYLLSQSLSWTTHAMQEAWHLYLLGPHRCTDPPHTVGKFLEASEFSN